jgi:hypothetical protein
LKRGGVGTLKAAKVSNTNAKATRITLIVMLNSFGFG